MLEKFQKDMKEGFDILQELWGMIFRALFIFAIGCAAYNWIDSHDIGDIPLARLTLKEIFGRIFAIFVVIACAVWFLHFPDRGSKDEESPYLLWARGSYCLAGIAIVAYFLWFRR